MKIDTKYNIGDVVFFMSVNGKVLNGVIVHINIYVGIDHQISVEYDLLGEKRHLKEEKDLFKSEKELLNK